MTKKITKLMLNGEEYEIREYVEQGWQPWVNTIWYRPLVSDINDHSWNNNHLTWAWTVAYSQVGWATINSYNTTSSSNYLYSTSITWMVSWNGASTQSMWLYFDGTVNSQADSNIYMIWQSGTSDYMRNLLTQMYTRDVRISQRGSASWTMFSLQDNTWHHIVITYDGTKFNCYLNWNKQGEWTKSIDTHWSDLYLMNASWESWKNWIYSNMSDVILENKARTAQEISDYYDLTKGNYWIS